MAEAFAEISALRLVLSRRKYLAAFLMISALFFFAYGNLLSSSSINLSGPKVAMGLNIYSLVASASISILFALSVAMSVFAFTRNSAPAGRLGLGAAITAVIPSSLCCTTLIPSILAALGASTSTIISASGTLQGPFATYETPLIAISIALLFLSVTLTSRSIASCCMVRK